MREASKEYNERKDREKRKEIGKKGEREREEKRERKGIEGREGIKGKWVQRNIKKNNNRGEEGRTLDKKGNKHIHVMGKPLYRRRIYLLGNWEESYHIHHTAQ